MDYYVYLHKKKTTGEVFYVGKGSGKRAWSLEGRNPLWKKIAQKHGYTVEIYSSNLQEWYAFELEKDLIDYYGKIINNTGTLSNISDGGDGPSGEGSPRADKSVYTFYNLVTNETITTTRINFKNKYPKVLINGIMTDRVKVSQNWVIMEKITQEDIKAFFSRYSGEYSITSDKEKRSFVNLKSGEEFLLTRQELSDKDKSLSRVGISNLVSGARRTHKGWAMVDSLNDFTSEHLLNPVKGDRRGSADRAEYTFKNLETQEIFKGTRSQFKEKYNIDVFTLFLKFRKLLTVKNWCLQESEESAKRTTRLDRTVYELVNNRGEIFIGTRKEFKEKHGFSFDKLVALTKPQKTHKGWKLVN